LLFGEKSQKKISEKQREFSIIECTNATVKWPSGSLANKQDEGNVLTDVSFTVKPGQITAIIGKLGCGKVAYYSLSTSHIFTKTFSKTKIFIHNGNRVLL